jgi:hypothetical protein
MAVGVNIDWSALPPAAAAEGSYINAFKTGQALAMQAANSPAQTDQLQAQVLGQRDGGPIVGQASAGGQPDILDKSNVAGAGGPGGGVTTLTATLDALPEDQRGAAIAKALQTNEQLARILQAFQGDPGHGVPPIPVAQRLSIAQHILTQHPELGLHPNSIHQDDVSDFGVRLHLDQAESMHQILKAAQRDAAGADAQAPRLAPYMQGVIEPRDPNSGGNLTPVGPIYRAPGAHSQGSGVRYIGQVGEH